MMVSDVLIVGGGPAGLSAAIYSARYGLDTMILSMDLGGQLAMVSKLENYPGFLEISGPELMRRLVEQVMRLGVRVAYGEAVKAEEIEEGFKILARGGGEYLCKALILACGKRPRKLGADGEDRLLGRGVSYCATCDAPLYRNRRTMIIGWGIPALEAAKILRSHQNRVIVVHGSRVSEESRIYRELRSLGAEILENMLVDEIRGEKVVESVLLKDSETGEEREVAVDAVFIELGHILGTEWLKGFIELNQRGEVVIDKLCRTSRRGVFAAGDVTDTPLKQVAVAVGQGALAANSAHSYLKHSR